MGAHDLQVTVEALDGMSSHLANLGSWFTSMESLVDTGRAQRAADSPLSSGALASFTTTMMDALRSTANSLIEDQAKLQTVADRYRAVDQQSARAADGLRSALGGEPQLPTLSVAQSQVTRAILEGFAGLDDVVVPAARAVNGVSDQIQDSLRSDAARIDDTATQLGRDIGRVNSMAGLGVRVAGAVAAESLRAADSALESVVDVVRGVGAWAEDVAARADRVLIRPGRPPR